MPEPVDSFNTSLAEDTWLAGRGLHQSYPATESSPNPFDPNFSNPNYNPQSQDNTPTSLNYNNPFTTATTLAGGLKPNMNPIFVSDDDLPF